MITQIRKIMCGIILILLLIVATPLIKGANDPGHDTLYIEQQGNSELNGSFNVTLNTTLKGGRAALISYLDIFYNGATPGSAPSIPTIAGTSTSLYLDSPGGGVLYLNKLAATGVVAVGDYATQTINLNVSGSLYVKGAATVGGQLVCLANGSNCPSNLSGANITGSGTQNTLAKFTAGTTIGNSIITETNGANISIDSGVLFVDGTNNRVGIGTTGPNNTLTVIGTINATTSIYQNNIQVAGSGTCAAGQYVNGTTTSGVTCNTPSGTTYTNGTGILLTGNQFNFSTTYGDSRYQTGTEIGNCSTKGSCLNIIYTGGTITDTYHCRYNTTGAGITCDIPEDDRGDCAAGSVCMGGHNHSTYTATGNCGSGLWVQNLTNTGPQCGAPTVTETDPVFTASYTTINTSIAAHVMNASLTDYVSNRILNTTIYDYVSNRALNSTTADIGTLSCTGSQAIANITLSNSGAPTGNCIALAAGGSGNVSAEGATAGYIPRFENATALNNSVIFQNGTNIGIGTTNPEYTLDVHGPVVAGDGTLQNVLSYVGSVGVIGTLGANNLQIWTGSSPRITLDTSGNVGIGTTSPNTTLHVAGKINVTAGNDICITGGKCLASTITSESDPVFTASYTTINTSIAAHVMNASMTDYVSYRILNTTAQTLISAKLNNATFDATTGAINTSITQRALNTTTARNGTVNCSGSQAIANLTMNATGNPTWTCIALSGTETDPVFTASYTTINNSISQKLVNSTFDATTGAINTSITQRALNTTVTVKLNNATFDATTGAINTSITQRALNITITYRLLNTSFDATTQAMNNSMLSATGVKLNNASFTASYTTINNTRATNGTITCTGIQVLANITLNATGNPTGTCTTPTTSETDPVFTASYTTINNSISQKAVNSSVDNTNTAQNNTMITLTGVKLNNATFTATTGAMNTSIAAHVMNASMTDYVSNRALNSTTADIGTLSCTGSQAIANITLSNSGAPTGNCISVGVGGGGGGNVSALGASQGYLSFFNNASTINSSIIYQLTTSGYIGISSSSPDAKLDVLSTTGPQLRLTYQDSTYYANFTVDSSGNLTLRSSSGNVIIQLG